MLPIEWIGVDAGQRRQLRIERFRWETCATIPYIIGNLGYFGGAWSCRDDRAQRQRFAACEISPKESVELGAV